VLSGITISQWEYWSAMKKSATSTNLSAKKSLTVGYHVPDDPALLAALGEISIKHGHLDHILKMMLLTFTGVRPQEAMDATARESSWSLRKQVRKAAETKLGMDIPTLVRVKALLGRCNRITKRRNALIHILCGKDQDGNAVAATEDLQIWNPFPTVPDLNTLSADMQKLIDELMKARGLWGFISVALLADKKPSGRSGKP
jgi:hypothetical protein